MIPRLATAVVLLLLFLGSLFYLPPLLFLVVLEVFLLLAGFELIKILQMYGLKGYPLTLPLTLAVPWFWVYQPESALNFLVASVLACTFQSVFLARNLSSGLPSVAGNFLTIFYLGLPVALALLLRHEELLWVLFVVWAGDIAAYLVGRRWGSFRVTPAISPGKSLEGFLAGLAAAAATSLLAGIYLRPEWPIPVLVLAGILVGLAGIVGDLFESLLKRGAGVKDSSRLLPGHGGILDRIDSLLLAIPAYFLLSALIK